jgi:hypothetical protein
MNTCYTNGSTNYFTNGCPPTGFNGYPTNTPFGFSGGFPNSYPTGFGGTNGNWNAWGSSYGNGAPTQSAWPNPTYCPPQPNCFQPQYAGFAPNTCAGNACPEFTGNGCCMTGTTGSACPPSFYSQNGFQGSMPWMNNGSTPWTNNAWCNTPWTNYGSTPWTNNAWCNTPWTNYDSTPWTNNAWCNTPWTNYGSTPWTNNAWCNTPWTNNGSTPWTNNAWCNTPWTNNGSTPWTNNAWCNSPWMNSNCAPFSGMSNAASPWGSSFSSNWSPTGSSNGFNACGAIPFGTDGAWCCVPTFTPWGLCFTTVPTAVYASFCASSQTGANCFGQFGSPFGSQFSNQFPNQFPNQFQSQFPTQCPPQWNGTQRWNPNACAPTAFSTTGKPFPTSPTSAPQGTPTGNATGYCPPSPVQSPSSMSPEMNCCSPMSRSAA